MEIFFEDLTSDAKRRVLKFYGIEKSEDANLDVMPLFILEKDIDVISGERYSGYSVESVFKMEFRKGARVDTPKGSGEVVYANSKNNTYSVKLDKTGKALIFSAKDVEKE